MGARAQRVVSAGQHSVVFLNFSLALGLILFMLSLSLLSSAEQPRLGQIQIEATGSGIKIQQIRRAHQIQQGKFTSNPAMSPKKQTNTNLGCKRIAVSTLISLLSLYSFGNIHQVQSRPVGISPDSILELDQVATTADGTSNVQKNGLKEEQDKLLNYALLLESKMNDADEIENDDKDKDIIYKSRTQSNKIDKSNDIGSKRFLSREDPDNNFDNDIEKLFEHKKPSKKKKNKSKKNKKDKLSDTDSTDSSSSSSDDSSDSSSSGSSDDSSSKSSKSDQSDSSSNSDSSTSDSNSCDDSDKDKDTPVQGFDSQTSIMHASVDNFGEYVYLTTVGREDHAPSILVFKLGTVDFTKPESEVPMRFVDEVILGPKGQLSAYPNVERAYRSCNGTIHDGSEYGTGMGQQQRRLSLQMSDQKPDLIKRNKRQMTISGELDNETPVLQSDVSAYCNSSLYPDVDGGNSFPEDLQYWPFDGVQKYVTGGHGPSWYPSFSHAFFTVWQDNRVIALDHTDKKNLNKRVLTNLGFDQTFGQKSQNSHGIFFNPSGTKALDIGYAYGANKLDLYSPVQQDSKKFDGKLKHEKEIFLQRGSAFGAFHHFVSWYNDRYAFTGTMQTGRTTLDRIPKPSGNGIANTEPYNVIPPSIWLIDTVNGTAELVVENVANKDYSAETGDPEQGIAVVDKPISDVKVVNNRLFVGQEDTLHDQAPVENKTGILLVFDIAQSEDEDGKPELIFAKKMSTEGGWFANKTFTPYDDNNRDALPKAGHISLATQGLPDSVTDSNFTHFQGIHAINVDPDGDNIYIMFYGSHAFARISTDKLQIETTFTERDLAHGAMIVGEYGSGLQNTVDKLEVAASLLNDGDGKEKEQRQQVNSNMLVGCEINNGHVFFVDTKTDAAKVVDLTKLSYTK